MAEEQWFNSKQGQEIFLFSTEPTLLQEPNQPHIQQAQGGISLGVKQPGCEANHSPTSSEKVKNAWSYTSTPHALLSTGTSPFPNT
jgi:hypothetical protein